MCGLYPRYKSRVPHISLVFRADVRPLKIRARGPVQGAYLKPLRAPQLHGVPHVRTSVRGPKTMGEAHHSFLSRTIPVVISRSKRRAGSAFGLYPRHQPRFPVELRGFPALHAPFLKRKAHTWSCPEPRTGNRGNRRVPHPSRSLRRVGYANLPLLPSATAGHNGKRVCSLGTKWSNLPSVFS